MALKDMMAGKSLNASMPAPEQAQAPHKQDGRAEEPATTIGEGQAIAGKQIRSGKGRKKVKGVLDKERYVPKSIRIPIELDSKIKEIAPLDFTNYVTRLIERDFAENEEKYRKAKELQNI